MSTQTHRGVHDRLRSAASPGGTAADGSAPGWSAGRTLPLRVEAVRQWRRRRTKIVLFGLAVFPVVLAVLFARNRGDAPAGTRLVDLATNGAANFALFVVFASSTFLLIVVVALFCGDTVASEASWSSLRYLVAIPVDRGRLLRQKLLVALGLSLTGLLILPLSALLAGGLLFGWGSVRTPAGAVISPGEAFFRLALVIAYLAVALLVVAAVAFCLGVFTDAPLGAVGGAVLLVILFSILDQVEDLGPVRQYLPTHYLGAWTDAISDPILWENMARGSLISLTYSGVLFAVAWRRFRSKDIVS
jgi:ABC-2 type transport system permease protein